MIFNWINFKIQNAQFIVNLLFIIKAFDLIKFSSEESFSHMRDKS